MSIHRPLGVSTSVLGAFLGTDCPEEALGVLASTPIHHFEYFCMQSVPRFRDAAHIARLQAVVAEHGLTPWSVHAPFDEPDLSAPDEAAREMAVDCAVAAVDLAVALRASLLVVHGSKEPVADDERPARLARLVTSLNQLCPEAARRGVRVALETLPRTCLGNRTAEVLAVLEAVDGPVGVCYDINHVTLYEPAGDSVRALGERIITLHLSDHDGVDERHWIPGRGVVDWPDFLGALDEVGYAGCLMHEATDKDAGLEGTLAAIIAAAREHLGYADGPAR